MGFGHFARASRSHVSSSADLGVAGTLETPGRAFHVLLAPPLEGVLVGSCLRRVAGGLTFRGLVPSP